MHTHHHSSIEPTLSPLLRQFSTAVYSLTLIKEAHRPRYRILLTWHYAPKQPSTLAHSDDQAEAEAMFQAMAVAFYAHVPHSSH